MKKGSKMTEKQENQYIPVGVKNEDIYKAALSVLKDTSEDTNDCEGFGFRCR